MGTEQINFRLDKDKIEILKKIARDKSSIENIDIKYTDLIRIAIFEKYFSDEVSIKCKNVKKL